MTNFGWNYPPGAANDPNAPYNQPDRSHDHEWRLVEDGPIIEDGAAIFHERCQYAEGRYGDGWECEETRTYRFEYSSLKTPEGVKFDLEPLSKWGGNHPGMMTQWVRDKVSEIEQEFVTNGPGGEISWDVDPDPDCGVVSIEWDGWTLKYEPQ